MNLSSIVKSFFCLRNKTLSVYSGNAYLCKDGDYYDLNIPPKICMLKLNCQCGNIKRLDLQEVIKL